MGVSDAQIGFMSGFGLGGIAERGREEDFFPKCCFICRKYGKMHKSKAKDLLVSLIRDSCTCPRFLSPLWGSRNEGVIGVQFLAEIRRRKQRKTLYLLNRLGTPRAELQLATPMSLCHSRAKLTSFKFHPPRKFILVLSSTVSYLNLQRIHATIRHGTLPYRREDLAVQRSWMIHAVDKAFTSEPGLDLNIFHFQAQFLSLLWSVLQSFVFL